jgi:hypothetical protein
VDVDPALEWAIVKTSKFHDYDPRRPDFAYETIYTYAAAIHGLPALKRIEVRNCWKAEDGTMHYAPLTTTEFLEFSERSTFDTSEYTLSHYGLGPPYLAYAGLIAAALLALGCFHVVTEWLRQRRRRGLSWATTE